MGENKSKESSNRMETLLRRVPKPRFTRTLRQRRERDLEWGGEEDYERVEHPSTARRERAGRHFFASSGWRRQDRESRSEREIAHMQEQINELTRQLKNAQQPPDEEVARLRQEIADLTILMSDATSPQNAELAYLRQQVNELTRQLQNREHENDSDT